MIYEISIVIGIFIFLAIAIYLIKTLITLQKALKDLHLILRKVDQQIEPVSLEAITLLTQTNNIAQSVSEKIEAFDPLFKSISIVGEMAHHATLSLQEKAETERKKKRFDVNDVIDLATLGLMLWQQIKKGDKHG